MVGKVIFRRGIILQEASLDEDSNWHCRDVHVERFLNESCRWNLGCKTDEGPGIQVLCQAAGVLNGQVVYC
jgi:hypothetical protein